MVENQSRFARYLARAQSKAAAYLDEPKRLKALIAQAGHKADHLNKTAAKGPMGTLMEQIALLSRLLVAYTRGEYRIIPWESVLMATAALVYFIMPLDAVSDWLVGLGLIDDALVMALAFKALQADLTQFAAWERKHEASSKE